MDYLFNPKTQRYHYKSGAGRGQFISNAALRFMMQQNITQTQADIRTVGDLLVNGKISLATWEETTAKALKNLHIQSYLLGRGGKGMMEQRDYGLIGYRLRREYQYLRKFAEELRTKGMTEAQFKQRLDQYTNAGNGLYQKAKTEGHQKAGYQWERRIRTKTESCQPCISFEGMGWQPIGTLPAPTEQCSCRSNCGCYKEFSKEKPRDFVKRFGSFDCANFSILMKKLG